MPTTQNSLIQLLSERLLSSIEPNAAMPECLQGIGQYFQVSRAVLIAELDSAHVLIRPIEWSASDEDEFDAQVLADISKRLASWSSRLKHPMVAYNLQGDPIFDAIQVQSRQLGLKSVLASNAHLVGFGRLSVILFQCDFLRYWSSAEISAFEDAVQILALGVKSLLSPVTDSQSVNLGTPPPNGDRYKRFVEHSDAIVFGTDELLKLNFVSRRALDFFGLHPEDITQESGVLFSDLLSPEDLSPAQYALEKSIHGQQPIDEEFRVQNRVTGERRWLLVRMVPVIKNGVLRGFDGFGVDISIRRAALEALEAQTKKIRALYTVSAAIRGYVETGSITSRGLAALCDATNADAGGCYLWATSKAHGLQLVSNFGFSSALAIKSITGPELMELLQQAAARAEPLAIQASRRNVQLLRVFPEAEGFRSGLIVPITVEEETSGVIIVLSREENCFDENDILLIMAAATQIGLAARQALLFSAHRDQTKRLAALYRMSHELSRNLLLEDIFHHAFSIIEDELGLERMWLGLLDETGTQIVGQAAYGPGWKRRLVEINVQIRERTHPIAEVVRKKKPVLLKNPREILQELGARRIFSRFGVDAVALVPMVSSGQVLGVLAVQLRSDDSEFAEQEIAMLSSLANEIGAVLLAKRLEDRVAESERMRTASILAGGIAHNFNNILQGILGQASLLEIQAEGNERVQKAVGVINESASRGAALVKQLLSFAHLDEPVRSSCDVNEFLDRVQPEFSRLLSVGQRLVVTPGADIPKVMVDSRQLTRVLSALIRNASEASPEQAEIAVVTDQTEIMADTDQFDIPRGRYVRIAVRDQGAGMDEETRRRCFEPFFTTKNVDPLSGLGMGGAGLGLSAAYAISRKNGGRLVVESRPGRGSVFTLFLPVVEPLDAGVEIERMIKPGLQRRSGTEPLRLKRGEKSE